MSNLIGKTLGPYRILAQIGVGGMATVYKAYQPSMERYVAIKVLPHYLSQNQDFVKRFQREARAIAKLEHAHILPVHDYGEHDGITYIAMRYVDAGTLKERMAKGPMPLGEIDRLVGQIGSALDYAHRMGVVHRDVKPGNVLIDDQGDTYLTDFGLARMMEASQQLTASGVGVGTPAYMSPEQGQGIKVDHRSDIYSLGVILYEMVTGRVPFEAETPMAVMLKHITDPLPLPRSVAPDVPESVEQVILKAMAKDPADRYQTAGEMAQALAAAVRQATAVEPHPAFTAEAVPVREDISFVTRVQRTWETPRGKVSLVGGALAGVILLGLLLSQIPGNIAIVGPAVTATRDGGDGTLAALAASATPPRTATGKPTATRGTPTFTRTPAPTRTPRPTSTPNPLESGQILDRCGADVCIFGYNGGSQPVGLAPTYVIQDQLGLGWSPDGSRFVLSGCLLEEIHDPARCIGDIYIASRDGKEITPLVHNPANWDRRPTWSPDGEWIAYEQTQSLVIIRVDGADRKVLWPQGESCFGNIAWSPDSQRLAWVTGPVVPNGCKIDRVRVINRDGTEQHDILSDPEINDGSLIAWSPDGESVAVLLDDGTAYQIDAKCYERTAGCDASSRTRLDAIPEHWLNNFYPQWAGEEVVGRPPAATPTPTLSPQAEPARTFAEPILQAIADRPPDFADDFSAGGRGWSWDESPGSSTTIANGVLRMSATRAIPGLFASHEVLNVSNFVLQVEFIPKAAVQDTLIRFGFRDTAPGLGYALSFAPDSGAWYAARCGPNDCDPYFYQGNTTRVKVGSRSKLVLIGKGTEFAIYLNDQLLTYFRDDSLPTGRLKIGMNPRTLNSEVEFDNFKFWNLDNVPGLP